MAKIISEEAALAYGQQTGLDVVTINPGLVFGPMLQPTVNTTIQFLIYFLKGWHLTCTSCLAICLPIHS